MAANEGQKNSQESNATSIASGALDPAETDFVFVCVTFIVIDVWLFISPINSWNCPVEQLDDQWTHSEMPFPSVGPRPLDVRRGLHGAVRWIVD
jgi:hypothetical protein